MTWGSRHGTRVLTHCQITERHHFAIKKAIKKVCRPGVLGSWGTMHVTGEVAGSIGVGLSTVLLHKLMVLTWRGSAQASFILSKK